MRNDSRFNTIDSLFRVFTKVIKNIHNGVIVFLVSSSKECQVVSKENMENFWCSLTKLNGFLESEFDSSLDAFGEFFRA